MMNQYLVTVITNNGIFENEFCVGKNAIEARNDYIEWLYNFCFEDDDTVIGTITECINYDI